MMASQSWQSCQLTYGASGLRDVRLAACARREWPWLPPSLPAGAVVIGPAGTTLRVRPDGGCDEVLPGGYARPGAAHSTATRRA